MVKHIILWKLKEEYSADQQEKIKQDIKTGLEGLQGKIPGLIDIHVHTDALPSSNVDLMLESTMTDVEALQGYSSHPDHVAVANSKVRPFYSARYCMDYEVK